ncbi:MAG TPA: O-antigen ligase family protein, partial [Pirellulaceae bacterium]|nr:O-antigen ligase family protein [Pirellulaceae bacterium]
MSHKRREQRRMERAGGESPIRWAAVLRSIVLGGAVTLIVIGALVPSESAISDGTYAPLAAGWCLLLVVWAASMWLDSHAVIQVGWTEAVGAALIGWHSLAALVSLGHTNGRHALNAHWLILGYGLTAFLLRQTVRTAEQARSLVTAMIWLATLLASLGLFQYFYSMPKLRGDYERDSPTILAANGIPTESDSPQRKLFEDRLRSREPLATFALTNSLAGVLGPWLVATLAIGLASLRRREQWRSLLALAAGAAVMAGCLVLTKSRTAYLAVLVGLALLALYGRGESRWGRLDWRIPAGLAGAVIVIGLVAVYSGGLDMQVLSESPKSVRYRLEYWQATARVIGDYPLFGCGPGNFQEAYAVHKLPQASETVADPHNVLLEMWATAGTPAVVLLVALIVAFAVDVSAALRAGGQSPAPAADPPVAPAEWIVFGGAVVGLLLAPAVAAAMGYPLEGVSTSLRSLPVVWLLGLALLAAAWWLLRPWLARGELTLAAMVIPQIVLLINLLAAGAMVFPAVITTFLVLTPVALLIAGRGNHANDDATPRRSAQILGQVELSPLAAGIATLASVAVALACLYTEYYPVLNGRLALADALYRLDQRQYREAEPKTIDAAKADSFSPEPWRLLGELRLAQWQATGRPKDWEEFVEAADTFR